MFKKILIPIVIVAVAGLGLYWFFQKQPEKYTGPIGKITIGATTQELSALIWIADDQDFFAENGLDATVKGYDTGIETKEALFAGEVDIADTVDFVVSGLALERDDFKILASIDTSRINKVIANKDQGISEPTDLKGKKIGLKQGSSSEYYIGRFLTYNDLSLEDVELVYVHPPDMPDLIEQGEIDATITWHPHNYHIQNRLGDNAIRWSAQGNQDVYWVILGMNEFIRANPQKIERLLKALIQAEEFTRENPEEAKKIMATRVNLDPDYIESIWSDFEFEVTLSQALLLTLEDQTRWRITNNLTDKKEVPNFLDFIYADGLNTVKPEAIKIIH